MSEPSTYIKLDRNIQDWRWYTDGNTFRLFVHLLLKANFEDKDWHGEIVKRGELVTSISHLSTETGLSVKEVRTALKHLKETNEVASHSTSQYTAITVINYNKYQGRASQTANEGQTKGKQGANEGQQLKKDKNLRSKEGKEVYTCSSGFDAFWTEYPKKKAKSDALKAWTKLAPDEDLHSTILNAIKLQKESPAWTKDNGQYIPFPATWLNAARWEDEPESNSNVRQGFTYNAAFEEGTSF